MTDETQCISSIIIDEKSLPHRTAETGHERIVAINDLIEWNYFSINDETGNEIKGPFEVHVCANDNRLTLKIKSATLKKPVSINILIASFRSTIRDYFLICESYFDAVKTGNLARIEAIDMSRRGLHNEGAEALSTLMEGKAMMDHETARRLFTLICALHLK